MPITLTHNLNISALLTTWNGSSFDLVQSVTIPSGAKALVVRYGGDRNISAMTFDGVAMNNRLNDADGSLKEIGTWDLMNPPVGTFDLIMDSGGTAAVYSVTIDTLEGIDTSSPIRGTAVDSLSAFVADSSLIITTVTDDLALDMLVANSTATVDGGQTTQILNDGQFSASYKEATTTSTEMGWTHVASWSALGVVVYKALTSGGWNNIVKPQLLVTDVTRVSDTEADITLGAYSTFDITALENITATIPTDVLVTGAGAIVSTPTFAIAATSAAVSGTIASSTTENDLVAGGKVIRVTLTGATFKAAGTGPVGSLADTQAILDGLTSNLDE